MNLIDKVVRFNQSHYLFTIEDIFREIDLCKDVQHQEIHALLKSSNLRYVNLIWNFKDEFLKGTELQEIKWNLITFLIF